MMAPESISKGCSYSENTRVCEMTVKCTRLCYWIARPAKPGVQSSYTSLVPFSLLFCTHPSILTFITYIFCLNGIEMELARWIWQSYLFFKFAICSIVLLNVGETYHLKGRDTLLLLDWYHYSALWHHMVWTCVVMQHNAIMGYEYSLPNIHRPRVVHKHKPHPLKTMGHVWYVYFYCHWGTGQDAKFQLRDLLF